MSDRDLWGREREERPPTVCGRCRGSGWAEVDEAYVDAQLALAPVVYVGLEAAVRNSSAPCPRCRPVTWQRWKEGHLASGHACSECSAIKAGGDRARAAVNAVKSRMLVNA